MAESDSRSRGRGVKSKIDRSSPRSGSIYAFLRPRVSGDIEQRHQAEVNQDPVEEEPQIHCETNGSSAALNDFFIPWSKRLRKRNSDASISKEPDEPVRAGKKLQKQTESPPKASKEEAEENDSLLSGYELRAEARRTTEQYARLSAGKPLHPFFQRNKSSEQPSADETTTYRGSLLDPAVPFHVFQDTQSIEFGIKWSRYEWLSLASEQVGAANGDYKVVVSEGQVFGAPSQAVFYASPVATSFETLADFLKGCFDDEELVVRDHLMNMYAGYQAVESSDSTAALNCLWTDTFQPMSSEQLCGNKEPVSVINEWLSSWRQKILSGKLESESDLPELSPDSDEDYLEDEDTTGELLDEAVLQNTLLVTGPVGCGKSAAVYACAREQGFNVIEINASECRAGAIVKQKFGEASESEALNWCDPDGTDDPHYRRKFTMLLFEEVDMLFEEDKGFLAALVHFAKSAKRPIVLTSNSRRPLLPPLRRTMVNFLEPAMKDMLLHAFMVLASTGLQGDPWVIQRIVGTCHRDVRKLMMQLQFWGQGALSTRKDKGLQDDELSEREKVLLPRAAWWDGFDAEYRVLPELVDLDFPCSQSKVVAAKILESTQEAEKMAVSRSVQAAEAAALRQAELLRSARRSKRLAKKAEAEQHDKLEVEADRQTAQPAPSIRPCDAGSPKTLRKLNNIHDESQPDIESGLVNIVSVEAEGLSEAAVEEPSTSNEQVDPVQVKWNDLRNGQTLLLRSDSTSVHTILSINDAVAAAEEAFSSCDILSTSPESKCFDISQHLMRRSIHHLLRECDIASTAHSNEQPSLYSPPWDEQHVHKSQKQNHLQEQIFLTNPKKARQALTSASFVDYISYMARIVAIEDQQEAELSRTKRRRSRGYQDDYLSEKGVPMQGIQFLRQLCRNS